MSRDTRCTFERCPKCGGRAVLTWIAARTCEQITRGGETWLPVNSDCPSSAGVRGEAS